MMKGFRGNDFRFFVFVVVFFVFFLGGGGGMEWGSRGGHVFGRIIF